MKQAPLSLMRSHALAVAMLAASTVAAAAQTLEIDSWPGLAGQPQARRDLITEYIRIPSLAQPPGTPPELNQTNFIRVRKRDADRRHADAILIQAIPNGASSFTESAAQLVEMAALRGKNFEVWGVERREKNLQDLAGMRQAIVHRDASYALHYYYGDAFLGPKGKFAGKLGGVGAKFVALRQADVPFLADWDAEVFNRDLESMIDLVPLEQRRANIFLYSASPGGGFLSQFAGFRLRDGNRGYQEIAGIVAIEGQLTKASIGTGAPTEKDIEAYIDGVQAIRAGTVPRFLDGVRSNLLAPGPSVAIPAAISLLAAEFAPGSRSIFPIAGMMRSAAPRPMPSNAALRLTNLARAGYSLSDDPLPGSFTTTFFQSYFGGGLGHLDFTPLPGTPACAQPGPLGMRPPCVPPTAQIDPAKVYGWVEGGPGGAGVDGNPLEGWTITSDGAFTAASADRGSNPARLLTAVQTFARPATLTNTTPLTIAFPTGSRTIDAGFNLGWAWYPSNRYHSLDVPFLNRFPHRADRPARPAHSSRLRQVRDRRADHRIHGASRHRQSLARSEQGLHRRRSARADRDTIGRAEERDESGRQSPPLQERGCSYRRQLERRRGVRREGAGGHARRQPDLGHAAGLDHRPDGQGRRRSADLRDPSERPCAVSGAARAAQCRLRFSTCASIHSSSTPAMSSLLLSHIMM